MIASGVICIIYVVCAVVLFLGVKEQKGKCWYIANMPRFYFFFSTFDVIKLTQSVRFLKMFLKEVSYYMAAFICKNTL